jgi:FtsX extracellular domain
MHRALVPLAVTAALVAGLAGCTKTASTTTPTTVVTPAAPDIKAFLRLPVATPSACPPNANGVTVGRTSPWANTVDMSVFLKLAATSPQRQAVARTLAESPVVTKTYFESRAEAYQEFQRLYTCSTSVSPSQTPASYRVVLTPSATLGKRNILVKRVAQLPGVDTVSCDPLVPCVNVVRGLSGSPTPSSSAAP